MGLCRERTGICDPREHFALQVYTKTIRSQFGRHLGLFRIHHYLSVAADLGVVQGRPLQAFALVVQLLKAIHQVALSNGGWELASLMLPIQDPLGPPRFAGDYGELTAVASYRDAMATLVPRIPGALSPSAADDNGDEDPGQRRWLTTAEKKAAAKSKAAARKTQGGGGKDQTA